MAGNVIPDGEKADAERKCSRCRQGGQIPRLIIDPATGRKHNFFECVACGYPNWTELREK
jgi:hypothetical protein